jgi:WD40 repeat protein
LDTARTIVGTLAFSPDSKILAAGSHDWTVRWWDVETGEPLVAPLKTRTDRIDSIAFSPDGQYLAVGSFDGLIDLWPGTFPAWVKKACQIVNRNLTAEEWRSAMGDEPYTASCPDLPIPATASGL